MVAEIFHLFMFRLSSMGCHHYSKMSLSYLWSLRLSFEFGKVPSSPDLQSISTMTVWMVKTDHINIPYNMLQDWFNGEKKAGLSKVLFGH